ncbi:protein dachsous isoform X2 [Pseudomyrmex gracilis]|uniref:protein dachsous isoform X2 n=1 Tax=Pseudomyrmex gracilis TaxID=219809 RepID=UPI0009952285|nr:protein dachsous isoform X2 [Pseudomyrmex gracilis]
MRHLLLLFLVLRATFAPGEPERTKYLQISENARPGTRVGYIEGINENETPPYLIVPVPGSAVDVDLAVESSGEIRTKNVLDRETRPTYVLVELNYNFKVIINVLDENDNAPTFPVKSVDVEFPENSPRDAKRALPPAKDPDLGQYTTQRYEIVSGNHGDVFRLLQHRGRDGVLYLDLNSGSLDRETRSHYHLVIEALDGGSPPLRSRLHVNVTVQDVNDNPPIFNQTRYVTSVPENATVGTPVLAVNATDADADDNGRIEYSINRRQSDREEMFRIDSETGMIYVNKALDFESKERHELVIVARDRGAQPLEASAFLSVSVTDVNDNHPTITVIFLSNDATPKISESAQPGEFVARISISDPDTRTEHLGNDVKVTGGEGHFDLTTRDNIIYLVVVEKPLDREETPIYDLSVEATDRGTPPLRAVRTFRLIVTDVNDNAPQFEREKYEAHLMEASEPGTSVLHVTATDLDEGANSAIRYSLQNTTWFTIDETTGLISTVTHVDCEADPAPTFVVVATDSGRPPLSSSATVSVTVHDLNDNEPIFEKPLYNATVSEDMSVGNCFLKVQATDPDCGVNAMVNYTLAGGRLESEQLLVRSDTGHICVRSPLDRETAPYLELPVIATDRGGLSTIAIVRILVTDVNDNPPIFEPRKYNVTLRSDSVVHGPILRLVATDLDAGLFGQLTYRITAGNEAGMFRIDRNTGELHLVRPSVLSRSPLYQLNVTATDAAGLKSLVDAEVKVTVSSAGHKIATCEKPRYTMTVKESILVNSVVGGVKKDNAATSSSSTGEQPSRFYLAREEADLSLDPNTGMLRIRQPLDRESRDKYVLSVEARNGGSVGYCQIELIVEDVNDNTPSFRTTSVRISVPESHPLHVPLYVAHATDPDTTPAPALMRYILGQNSNDLFGIDGHSGEVYLTRRLDYETQQRHGLLIRALDGAGLSANLSLSVEVQDVNDNPPVFERNEYHVEVPEGARLDSQILQVTAVDLDTGNNARLSYRLVGSAAFRINPNTGWIYLVQNLDREVLDRHVLTILATDNGSPAATASTSVLVTVLDDNDNDPRFGKDFYGFELLENLPSGTLVGSVNATDPDLGNNSLLRYAIVQANSSFAVDPDTGEITTREPLDRETKSVHELVLEARDRGTPSRATRVPMKVTVLDVNDNSPEIVDPQRDVVSIREEQPSGTEVAKVRALDIDLGENASVTYSILKDRDSDGYNVFTIDPITGMIRTKAVLDHEERNVYRVSVKATDAGHPPRHSVRALRVEVLALADNRPTFTSSSLTFNVREDASIGHAVGSVSGASPAGRVAFTLDSLTPISKFPAFDVDRSSGQLVVANSLDRESVSEYHLEIRALDTTSIGNPQSIAVSVKIVIEDANDNAPKWPQDPITVRVFEKAAIGSTIYNLTASDLDSGLNGELRYGLVAEFPPKDCFAVDSLTGALTLAKQLDREERGEYTLILKASDRASPGEQLASTVTARIIVLDQNDNDPVFVSPESTEISVASNLQTGASLVRVVAVDKDSGDNGRVSYVITSGNEEARFSVGYDSGIVTLMKPVTKLTDLEITANDHGSPPRKAVLKLSLTPATAQMSGPPRLLKPNPVVMISENLNVGASVLDVAGPAAKQKEGNVTFSIPNDTASNKFAISSDGQVTLRSPLDREKVSRYSVSILARSNKRLDITNLDVIVLDENDNSPEFRPGSCYTLAVPENQKISAIHTVAATDTDEGKNGEIVYSIASGNIGSKFNLNPTSGVLSMSNLDRETVPKYVLTISAMDRGKPSRESHCNLTVIVLDINDNAPTFAQNQYTEFPSRNGGFQYGSSNYPANYHSAKYATTILEDVPPDSSVMSVKAADPDQGANGKITYAIAEETSWLFRVDNLTGVVTTAGSLDRERQNSYTFLIVATDSGKYDAKSTSISVEITIRDVNDNAPVFHQYPFRTHVSIGTQPGQNILRVSATDADEGANGEIVYSFLHEQEKPKFRIHPSTGEVTAALSLSQDNGKTYHLQVLATDKGNPPKSAEGLIELQVGDHADLTPALKFQNDTYNVVVQENSVSGTEIVQITAVRTDGRRQHVSYSIASGNDFDTFAIDENSGLLRVNNPIRLDAELWNDLTVRPSDEVPDEEGRTNSWGRSLEGQQPKEEPRESSRHILNIVARTAGPDVLEAYVKVIVKVFDVNDNPPIFTQIQYSATVLEGNAKGDFVVKLSASDADQGLNSRILYHIVDGNPDNAFTISPPYSGVVRTNIVLDREIREKYRLTIIATDQGNPQLTGTAALSVRVIDVNDNQPTFPEHSIISISEGTIPGTVLTTLTANDVDSSPELTYRFSNMTSSGPFSIDRYGGKIVLRERLDAETRSEYTLRVIASDGIHEATTDLTVRVTDLNDNAPRFEQAAYVAVLSGREALQEILTVNATDDDLLEENSRIRYYLLRPVKGFSIHPTTGVLTVNRTAIPRPIPKEMNLAIVAEDHGKPPASSMCSVVVRLSSLKNASPGREYKLTVKENSPKGTTLMRLSDVDLLDGTIVAGDDSGMFEISRNMLILSRALDRETKDSYVLRLSSKSENVTDSLVGDEPVTMTIIVEDVNDNSPRFLQDIYEVSIQENATQETTVTVLRAKDDDLPNSAAATLLYDITSGNDRNLFRVDKTTGAILVNSTLDCDLEPDIYNLVVMACDSDPVLPLCALAKLRIHLEDVNDNSPKFPVSEYLEFVGENEPIGTTVFTARATDLDRGIFAGSLNYSIASAAANGFSDIDDSWKLFEVDAKSGTVTTRAMFDYEQRNRYAFTLRATDTGGLRTGVNVRVEIESRDEFFPQFTERTYRFGIRSRSQMIPGTVIGHVTATDRDKGPDGRVVYQLTSQHPYFKLNRTTGALIVKQKLMHIDMDVERPTRLIVSASSGRQGSLSNKTVVEITLMDDDELNGATALATPTDVGSNMAVAPTGGLADWVVGLLIALFLLILAFGALFLYLHIRNRRHKKPGTKPGLNGESNATASNSYVDPSAFDTIPIRSVAGVSASGNGSSGSAGGGGGGASCQFAPPKYDEIPPYGTSGQSGQQQATSELSGSDQSGSSGRGSAEDDGEDEEIRMINEGQQTGDSASDLSVHNTQEYLARLGIVDPPAGTPRRPPEALPLDSLHLFEDEASTEADIATLIYGKIGESGRPTSGLEMPGGPSMNGSLSSIVHSEEELTGSYNWDYLLDWGPQYQPLAHVFSEIARLKDDAASVQSGNSGSSGKTKSVHKAPPPPLLTSVAPRSLAAPALARGILPRSPISHDASTFPSAALSPSFSPSLSPLATRSPSISPLVPPTTQRSNQSANRGIPVTDAELRI